MKAPLTASAFWVLFFILAANLLYSSAVSEDSTNEISEVVKVREPRDVFNEGYDLQRNDENDALARIRRDWFTKGLKKVGKYISKPFRRNKYKKYKDKYWRKKYKNMYKYNKYKDNYKYNKYKDNYKYNKYKDWYKYNKHNSYNKYNKYNKFDRDSDD